MRVTLERAAKSVLADGRYGEDVLMCARAVLEVVKRRTYWPEMCEGRAATDLLWEAMKRAARSAKPCE